MERILGLVTARHDKDADLVARVRSGERAAFDVLFQRHKQFVFNVCYRVLGCREEATDATQTAFVQAYSSIHAFRGGSAFKTWLYRIATNVAIGLARKQSCRTTSELDEARTSEPESSCDAVWEAMLDLPPDLRTVLVLFYFQGLSGKELADVLGCSEGAARTRLHRARKAFKKRFEEVGS